MLSMPNLEGTTGGPGGWWLSAISILLRKQMLALDVRSQIGVSKYACACNTFMTSQRDPKMRKAVKVS